MAPSEEQGRGIPLRFIGVDVLGMSQKKGSVGLAVAFHASLAVASYERESSILLASENVGEDGVWKGQGSGEDGVNRTSPLLFRELRDGRGAEPEGDAFVRKWCGHLKRGLKSLKAVGNRSRSFKVDQVE